MITAKMVCILKESSLNVIAIGIAIAGRSQSNIPLNFGLCSWNGEYKPAKPRKQNAQNLKWGYIPQPGEHKWSW